MRHQAAIREEELKRKIAAAFFGKYDYQIVEDVNLANGFFANGLPERSRPWHG